MLKFSENPPILYPEDLSIEEIPGQWRVAHTKSRNEKALASVMCKWQIPYFLPLVEKTTKRKHRIYKSLLPLFSGYLFFCGTQEQRYRALTSNRIAQVIDVIDQDKFIKEITAIHKAIYGGMPIDTHPYLKAGKRCRVIGGALMGCEGMIEQKKNMTRIVLQVDMLGQSAAVEIDADLLEPID
ncbi:MAG: hypothetical protein JW860_09720 [Sedimentisphaerales bacterium]|nr:hypothetical protein [Sedimentisphaerales bacterium]